MKIWLGTAVALTLAYLLSCTKPAVQPPQRTSIDSLRSADSSRVPTIPPDSISKPSINTKVKIFDSLAFNALNFQDQRQYFSTFDSSFHRPMKLSELNGQQIKNVDILYFYDAAANAPGFLSPYTASQVWYWNDEYYYYPWLSSSPETIFHWGRDILPSDFEQLKSDSTIFDSLYSDVFRIPANIFPEGTKIGGRNVTQFKGGDIYTILLASGKRGFIMIRKDQDPGWPISPIYSFQTLIDLIVEK